MYICKKAHFYLDLIIISKYKKTKIETLYSKHVPHDVDDRSQTHLAERVKSIMASQSSSVRKLSSTNNLESSRSTWDNFASFFFVPAKTSSFPRTGKRYQRYLRNVSLECLVVPHASRLPRHAWNTNLPSRAVNVMKNVRVRRDAEIIDIPKFHPRRGTSCFSRRIFICFSKSLPKLTPNVRKRASSATLYLILRIYPNSQRAFRSGRSRDATIYLHVLFRSEGTTLSHDMFSMSREASLHHRHLHRELSTLPTQGEWWNLS